MNRNHIHFALGMPGKKGVISGMRSSCEVVYGKRSDSTLEINIAKAMAAGYPFFLSTNKVILCPGAKEKGCLPMEFFRSVTDMKNNQLLYSAPLDYICVYDFEC